MKLDTKKKRLWFVIWCLWSIGWFVAYIVGGFFVLRDCNLYRSAIMTCEFDFKLFGFIFFAFVIPAILIAATLMISKIKSWVSSGEQNFLTIQSSRPPTAAADFRRQALDTRCSWKSTLRTVAIRPNLTRGSAPKQVIVFQSDSQICRYNLPTSLQFLRMITSK